MVNGQVDHDVNVPARGPCAPTAKEPTDRQLLEQFVRKHDGSAFQALVERHGPMVLAVCERVLHHAQDAEDAFQATFLVLVRKAGSIGQPELLANWLYGVAYRTALKARANAVRRSENERQAVSMPTSDPLLEIAWRELRALLDEELSQLPEKYRAPLVLCYLQGKTNEEAARQLGWPAGSMSARLARGREMLRDRLAGRNRSLPAGMFLAVLSQKAGAATLPGPLVTATVKAAMGWAVGKVAVSPAVRGLVEAPHRALTGAKVGKAAVVTILLALILAGAGAAAFAAGLVPGTASWNRRFQAPPPVIQSVPATEKPGSATDAGKTECNSH
jgi:RNA polymerase sigma factor (sigma-70 family)